MANRCEEWGLWAEKFRTEHEEIPWYNYNYENLSPVHVRNVVPRALGVEPDSLGELQFLGIYNCWHCCDNIPILTRSPTDIHSGCDDDINCFDTPPKYVVDIKNGKVIPGEFGHLPTQEHIQGLVENKWWYRHKDIDDDKVMIVPDAHRLDAENPVWEHVKEHLAKMHAARKLEQPWSARCKEWDQWTEQFRTEHDDVPWFNYKYKLLMGDDLPPPHVRNVVPRAPGVEPDSLDKLQFLGIYRCWQHCCEEISFLTQSPSDIHSGCGEGLSCFDAPQYVVDIKNGKVIPGEFGYLPLQDHIQKLAEKSWWYRCRGEDGDKDEPVPDAYKLDAENPVWEHVKEHLAKMHAARGFEVI